MPDDHEKIRITLDEVERVNLTPQYPPAPSSPPPLSSSMPGGGRQWGSVATPGAAMPAYPAVTQEGGFYFQGWFYLSLAGLLGAFLAWAICEPSFVDGSRARLGWGNTLMFPMLLTLICTGLGIAESVVERSTQKAVTRGILAIILGIALGFALDYVSNRIYRFLLTTFLDKRGAFDEGNPVHWFCRAAAWVSFGIGGGLVYGIVGRSAKKCLYGIIGGVVGAGIGGFLFDPIAMFTHGGAVSRMIGLAIFGASTGLAIGLVESALKDRWLYVSGGPLAGKQFILYKPVTCFGSQQSNDVYLFKDPSIQPRHATVEIRGGQAILLAMGPTLVAGQPVAQRVLRSGDVIQIGRYSFSYQEKHQGH